MSNIRVKGKLLRGTFTNILENDVRVVRNSDGEILGTITQIEDGWRISRADGKIRTKPTLEDAFKSCARLN